MQTRTWIFTLPLLAAMAGCTGPIGTWTLHKVEPAAAAEHFTIKRITFAPEQQYTMKARRGNTLIDSRGTYELDKDAGVLKFTPENGPERTYRVEICGPCGLMHVMNPGEHQRWKATLKRR